MRLRPVLCVCLLSGLSAAACADSDEPAAPDTTSDTGAPSDADVNQDTETDVGSDLDVLPTPDTNTDTDTDTSDQETATSVPEASLNLDSYASEGVAETIRVTSEAEIDSVEWQFGSRDVENATSDGPEVSVTYPRRGRYTLNAVVRFANGQSRTVSGRLTVIPETLWEQNHSSTIAVSANDLLVAVVSPDSDEVAVFSRREDTLTVLARHATCDDPRTVTFVDDATLAVACQDDDSVWILPAVDSADREAVICSRLIRHRATSCGVFSLVLTPAPWLPSQMAHWRYRAGVLVTEYP
jgi:hypothetical protein